MHFRFNFDACPLEGLHDAARTYTHIILPRRSVTCLYDAV